MALCTHEVTHSDLHFANRIIAVSIVDVDHHELVVLHFLEEVADVEARLEVRVQVVVDCLGLGNLHPLVASFLEEATLRVRLTKRVQVLKFAAGDE